ncbi:MAG: hypothetical protein ACLQGP_41435 [Isosphaeraceae bacterium]
MISPTFPIIADRLTIAPDVFSMDDGIHPQPEMAPLNGQPMTLAEVVEHEMMGYRAWGTTTGEFLAREMERLAQLIRWTGASTPEEHEERIAVWDEEIRDQWFERGYQEGYEAGRHDAVRTRLTDAY